MKRIGLTQRVEIVPQYGERRDCLDQAWGSLITSLGYFPVPLPNLTENASTYIAKTRLDGVILTGGNDIGGIPGETNVASERDNFEKELLDYCLNEDVPIFGVCRGLQMIVLYFEGELSPVTGHIGTRHNVSVTNPSWPFSGRTFEVNSYHGYGITERTLPEHLTATAIDNAGNVEAVQHTDAQASGIMWHPEREIDFTDHSQMFVRYAMEGTFDL